MTEISLTFFRILDFIVSPWRCALGLKIDNSELSLSLGPYKLGQNKFSLISRA